MLFQLSSVTEVLQWVYLFNQSSILYQAGLKQNCKSLSLMNNTKNSVKKLIPKNTQSSASKIQKQKQRSPSKQKRARSPTKKQKENIYKIDFIKKDNFDNFHNKINITQIKELPIKYTLHCIDGVYKNRFLYITTHVDGEVFGSGNAKAYGLTLQIEGAGLSPKHAQLKFDGFKNFDVIDFDSQNGTWMNISKQGVDVKDGQSFSIGPYVINFTFGHEIDQIQEICMTYHVNYLSDTLTYNGIRTLGQLYAAEYTNFKGFPFKQKQIQKIRRISNDSKKWFQEGKNYRRLIEKIQTEPHKDFQVQIGWQSFYFGDNPDQIFHPKNVLAQVNKGRLLPIDKVFARITPNKAHALSLHCQLKLGNLMFQLNRFNTGKIIDIGNRTQMEDGLLIEEDVGGSEWKLVSLFAVFDGHGGPQCMAYFRDNLLSKIRQWIPMLDEAGHLNQMVKVLMNKTFFELDYEFYQEFPHLANVCGCTAQVVLLIQSKAYVFSIGDCKGFIFRNEIIYQMSLDHLPSRGDERSRIENAGGFVQYDRLMGKCLLSRALGQFQYKSVEDYEGKMKGPQKSYLSCIPDMSTFDINPQTDDFLLISTDGLLQSLTIAQITDFIMQRYSKLELQESPNKILSSLVETSKVMSKDCDNMAAILIILRKGLVGSKKVIQKRELNLFI